MNGNANLPWRPWDDLRLGQTVAEIALVSAQFPHTDVLVHDPPGFRARRRGTLLGQHDRDQLDAQVVDQVILAGAVALAAAVPLQLQARRDRLVVAVVFGRRVDLVVGQRRVVEQLWSGLLF